MLLGSTLRTGATAVIPWASPPFFMSVELSNAWSNDMRIEEQRNEGFLTNFQLDQPQDAGAVSCSYPSRVRAGDAGDTRFASAL